MVLAGWFLWQAMNLASKQCSDWDLALLKTPPLLLFCCSLETSLPSTRACPLPALAHVPGHGTMGRVPLKRDKLAAAHCHSEMAHNDCGMALAPVGTLNSRRSSDPKCQAAAVFPATSPECRLAGAQFIALPQRVDGFHTPALGVFMVSLPVKRIRGHFPQAPKALLCSGNTCSPSSSLPEPL